MRVPKIVSKNIEEVKVQVRDFSQFSNPQRPLYDVEDDKSYQKLIKKIERFVRSSLEYREYIDFLKSEINMNQCALFSNLDRTEMSGISLEIHHSPLTLYDITSIVTNKHIMDNKKINPLRIAEEVMKLHFMGKVGLIPLSVTVHQLVHNGDVFIPLDKVYGNISGFISEYKEAFTQEQKDLLYQNINMTENLINYSPAVLERNYTYLNINGIELPRPLLKREEEKIG